MIAIPSGIQIFCWIATLWDGRPQFKTPLLFVLGFFFIFVLGGLTGVMLASVPLDLQVHDTYFVVAHFHYVLIGGAVFPLFGGVLLLVPEDHRADARRAARQLELLAVLHRLQPRLLPDAHPRADRHAAPGLHLPGRAWAGTSSTCSPPLGAGLIAASVAAVRRQRRRSRRHGAPRRRQPLGRRHARMGDRSPPPPYNFEHIPVVARREPLWEEPIRAGSSPGCAATIRELLVTGVVDAEPDHRERARPSPRSGRSSPRSRPPACSSARSSRPGRVMGPVRWPSP